MIFRKGNDGLTKRQRRAHAANWAKNEGAPVTASEMAEVRRLIALRREDGTRA